MWSKKDSENLESIAKSLERLAERELERDLTPESNVGIVESMKRAMKDKIIKVREGSPIEDEALEEEIKITQRAQNKVLEAERNGNSPFFVEALLDEEELETL